MRSLDASNGLHAPDQMPLMTCTLPVWMLGKNAQVFALFTDEPDDRPHMYILTEK